MTLGVVDDEALAGVVEEVARHLDGDVDLLVDEPRRLDRLGLLLEARPEPGEIAQVALQVLEAVTLGDGAHDEAGVLRLELLGDVAQPVAFGLPQAPGDAHAAAAGHVHEVAPGQGDLGAQPGALAAHRVLGDLHEHLLAVLEGVADAPGALLAVRRQHLVHVQEAVLLEAEVDEGRVDAGEHVVDLALVDVAQVGLLVGALDVDLGEAAVLDQRDAQLAAVVGHEDDLALRQLRGHDRAPAQAARRARPSPLPSSCRTMARGRRRSLAAPLLGAGARGGLLVLARALGSGFSWRCTIVGGLVHLFGGELGRRLGAARARRPRRPAARRPPPSRRPPRRRRRRRSRWSRRRPGHGVRRPPRAPRRRRLRRLAVVGRPLRCAASGAARSRLRRFGGLSASPRRCGGVASGLASAATALLGTRLLV